MSEIEYACRGCSTVISVANRAAGKTMRCPQCGELGVVPRLQDDCPIILPPPARYYREAEPWFYAFIEFLSYLSIALAVLCACFGVWGLLAALAAAPRSESYAILGTALRALAVALSIAFCASLSLLAVDIGRNIRAGNRR